MVPGRLLKVLIVVGLIAVTSVVAGCGGASRPAASAPEATDINGYGCPKEQIDSRRRCPANPAYGKPPQATDAKGFTCARSKLDVHRRCPQNPDYGMTRAQAKVAARRRAAAARAAGAGNTVPNAADSGGAGSEGGAGADFVLVPSQSSCQENAALAYVNCSIGVRNNTDSASLPTVWVLYRYSDSGTTIDSSDNGSATSDPIPAHSLGWVYFSHPYKATDHDLIQAAATLDANKDSWPYIRVADPSDVNWPD